MLLFEGDMIVSGSFDSTVKIWSVRSGECLKTLEGHSDGISSVAINGDIIVSGSGDNTVKIWSIKSKYFICKTLTTHRRMCFSVAYFGDMVVSASADGEIKLCSRKSREYLKSFVGHLDIVTSVKIDEDKIVSGSMDGTVKMWCIRSAKCLKTFRGHCQDVFNQAVFSVAIDGDTIVSGSSDRTVKIWSIRSGKCLKTLEGHSKTVLGVAIADDIIVSGSKDKTVKIWSRKFLGAYLSTLEGHDDTVTKVAINRDVIVSGSYDSTVKIWSRRNWRCLKTLKGHARHVYSVAIDGDLIVSGSGDNTVKIWSATSGKCLKTLEGHRLDVLSVAICDDMILSGSEDKTVKIWPKPQGKTSKNHESQDAPPISAHLSLCKCHETLARVQELRKKVSKDRFIFQKKTVLKETLQLLQQEFNPLVELETFEKLFDEIEQDNQCFQNLQEKLNDAKTNLNLIPLRIQTHENICGSIKKFFDQDPSAHIITVRQTMDSWIEPLSTLEIEKGKEMEKQAPTTWNVHVIMLTLWFQALFAFFFPRQKETTKEEEEEEEKKKIYCPLTFGELVTRLTNAMATISLWEDKHEPRKWRTKTEKAAKELEERASEISNGNPSTVFISDPKLLEDCHDQIHNYLQCISEEESKLLMDDPSSDAPDEDVDIAIDLLRDFVNVQLDARLDQFSKKISTLKKMYDSYMSLSKSDLLETGIIKQLLIDIDEVAESREDKEHKLGKLKRKLNREGDESKVTELTAQIEAIESELNGLNKLTLSRKITCERARLLQNASDHFPELLKDSNWLREIGLQDVVDNLRLAQSGLWLQDVSIDEFTILETLSSSPAKAVYIVQGNDGPRKVLKKFALSNTESQRHFSRQCSILNGLKGSNVVQIHGVFIDGANGFLLMPYYENGDLQTWLAENDTQSRVIMEIATDILNGIVAIHESGHVHCDLKPANVFLSKNMHAFIGDFDGIRDIDQTQTGLMTTFAYLAPEYKDGRTKKAHASMDLFAFGLILKDLFPIKGSRPKFMNDLIHRLLSKDPTRRPTAKQVLQSPPFESDPSTFSECQVCVEKWADSEGIACDNGHFQCAGCTSNWLRVNNNITTAPDGSVCCFVGNSCGQMISSRTLATSVNEEVWQAHLKRLQDLHHANVERDLEHRFEERLKAERAKSFDDQMVDEHRRSMIELLTLKCPSCSKAFHDFRACFAVQCKDEQGHGCKNYFCAWCLEALGKNSQRAHRHVANCPKNKGQRSNNWRDHNKRLEEMKKFRSAALRDYWDSKVKFSTSSEIQDRIRESLAPLLDETIVLSDFKL